MSTELKQPNPVPESSNVANFLLNNVNFWNIILCVDYAILFIIIDILAFFEKKLSILPNLGCLSSQ